MAQRLRKWFTTAPSSVVSGPAQAIYNGVDELGNRDPIGEGTIGQTYQVTLLSASKLEAPCPPFCQGDAAA